MVLLTTISLIFIIGYFVSKVYLNKKPREVELNFYLMQAKRILNKQDFEDKRAWYVNKFKEAENSVLNAQASCKSEFDFNTISDIREKQDVFKNLAQFSN